jgi:hypothetical protein
MEKDLNMSDEGQDFHIEHPIVSYCFAVMEYIRDINPELFKKAVEYAEDLTGVVIQDFTLEESKRDADEKGSIDITEEIKDSGVYGLDYTEEDEEGEDEFYDDDQYYG